MTGSHKGGAHKEIPSASGYPDFIANFTVSAAAKDSASDGMQRISGTSFSAPTVAGTAAGAIHLTRRALHHTTGIEDGALAPGVRNGDVRSALNATAEYRLDVSPAGLSIPNPPFAPFVTAGWGYLDGSHVGETADRVLSGDLDVPEEKTTAALWMGAHFASRKALWDPITQPLSSIAPV